MLLTLVGLCLSVAQSQPAAPATAQTSPQTPTPSRIEIRVEQKQNGVVKQTEPDHIFQQGDLVRFKVKANFQGYLYVMDQGTSGKYLQLFPGADAGQMNRIEKGKDYLVPSTESGWFRIEGPAGHDVVYWVISPAELTQPAGTSSVQPIPAVPTQRTQLGGDITPRCDDTVFKANGDCVDTSAGARPVRKSDTVPDNLSQFSDKRGADLLFLREQNLSMVSSPDPLSGPIIYEFHLSHK